MKNKTKSNQGSSEATLKAIGKKLAELRINKGFSSQISFATEYGLSHIQYWRMENGSANLTFKSLDRVLAIHGMTIEELFKTLSKTSRKSVAR